MADSTSQPGQTQRFEAPWTWNGRIWARTGCNFNSNWQPACETGDCDGRLQCNGLIGTPPATLVQIALQGDKGKPNFYDVSLVDGYNLPVSVATRPFFSKCTIRSCSKNLKNLCTQELEVLNKNGEVVACLAFVRFKIKLVSIAVCEDNCVDNFD